MKCALSIAAALDIQPYKLFMQEADIYIANLPPSKKQELVTKLQQAIEDIIYGYIHK